MATTPKVAKTKAVKSETSEVNAFMASLDHPLKSDIELVRKLILSANLAIFEGIKWNAPSFAKADWFATFHLRSRDSVRLVFHTGAKAKDNPDFKIADRSNLIKWLAKDRCLITLGAGKTLKTHLPAFEKIVKAWISYV
jgi:hypothetical protein